MLAYATGPRKRWRCWSSARAFARAHTLRASALFEGAAEVAEELAAGVSPALLAPPEHRRPPPPFRRALLLLQLPTSCFTLGLGLRGRRDGKRARDNTSDVHKPCASNAGGGARIRHGKLLGQIRIRIARCRELVAIDVVVAAMSENDELHCRSHVPDREPARYGTPASAHFGDDASAVGAKLLSTNGRSVRSRSCAAARSQFPPAIRSSLMLLMQQNLVLRDSSHKTGAAYLVKRAPFAVAGPAAAQDAAVATVMCAPVSATDARDGCHTPATIPAIHLACARYFWRRGQRASFPLLFPS